MFLAFLCNELQMIIDLDEGILESALALFPNLVGLHIVGCPKLDHVTALQLTSHTPLLESLSLTTTVSCQLGLSFVDSSAVFTV